MPATIYLIRHGQTRANEENRFAGRSAEPLNKQGQQQLHGLATKLVQHNLSHIYAGPLTRTMESAQIIARVCRLEVEKAPELIDINLPHWEGLTKDEIRKHFGDEYPCWLASPATFHVADCETLLDVQQRAMNLVQRIQKRHATGTILLVTHLIVARCLILATTKQPMSTFRDIKVANGEVVQLLSEQITPSQYHDD